MRHTVATCEAKTSNDVRNTFAYLLLEKLLLVTKVYRIITFEFRYMLWSKVGQF